MYLRMRACKAQSKKKLKKFKVVSYPDWVRTILMLASSLEDNEH